MKVLATGVFNILHPGHILFLEEAKKLGDELIVIISHDTNVSKPHILPQEQRAKMLASLKPVDKVLIGDPEDKMRIVREIRPNIIALGHDQEIDESKLYDKLSQAGIGARIVRIEKKLDGKFMSSTAIASFVSH